MAHFPRRSGLLFAEELSLSGIADRYGTPCFVYSRAALKGHYQAFEDALSGRNHQICYAVKANSSLAVLGVLAHLGAGFDIVSMGELERVLRAGGAAQKIVFSGVGKTANEMRAALKVGIRSFNVESEPELVRLNEVAGSAGQSAPVALRVNPDVGAATHPYIATGLKENKFGIEIERARSLYLGAADLPNIRFTGIACHIGSQLTEVAPFEHAAFKVMELVRELAERGIKLEHIDLGGGLGIRYHNESPPDILTYIDALLSAVGAWPGELSIEPGRAIAGNAGVLLTRIEYIKHATHKNFLVVDAAMNDLMRPALYQAWHDIQPVEDNSADRDVFQYDVVGPVCESSDFLGKDRKLAVEEGDLLAVMGAGAYGFVMSSNYNSRPRAAEIMVDGSNAYLVRERETIEDLMRGERVLDT